MCRGLTNYSSEELERIKGKTTQAIEVAVGISGGRRGHPPRRSADGLGLKRLNLGVQSGFMSCGFVFVDNALRHCTIKRRDGSGVGRAGDRCIAAGNGGDGLFDGSPHRRSLAGIVAATFLGLLCAFFLIELNWPRLEFLKMDGK